MIDSIYIGKNGLRAQQQVVETISNNIANLNSISFKKQQTRLSQVIVSQLDESERASIGAQEQGPAVTGIWRNMSQGQPQKTDRPLDLAIQGAGFFIVRKQNGDISYTRSGSFGIDPDGYVSDKYGNRLEPEIQLEGGEVDLKIGADGMIQITTKNGSTKELGVLELAYFANPDALQLDGAGVFVETEESGRAVTVAPGQDNAGLVMQGYLEGSNVNLVDEFTSLVMAQRAYEASAKIVQTAGEMFDAANSLLKA
ncbi:flagellar basal body rod protein FlgG [Chitiniphilus shinanonensis]|uniref:Flagellar basal body rod protein FlgG n=1 Tax=Chitiniphilus shinanonensis TaxID=553088 RepID=A0ABQ6BSC4_9NEIS|nr:flagellar hook basal-body protein [Chitiniphilus shinanonensis]GLS04399.1 flagellar basal body rod protein FlgG [Chitiniphilus shinanonensis]